MGTATKKTNDSASSTRMPRQEVDYITLHTHHYLLVRVVVIIQSIQKLFRCKQKQLKQQLLQ